MRHSLALIALAIAIPANAQDKTIAQGQWHRAIWQLGYHAVSNPTPDFAVGRLQGFLDDPLDSKKVRMIQAGKASFAQAQLWSFMPVTLEDLLVQKGPEGIKAIEGPEVEAFSKMKGENAEAAAPPNDDSPLGKMLKRIETSRPQSDWMPGVEFGASDYFSTEHPPSFRIMIASDSRTGANLGALIPGPLIPSFAMNSQKAFSVTVSLNTTRVQRLNVPKFLRDHKLRSNIPLPSEFHDIYLPLKDEAISKRHKTVHLVVVTAVMYAHSIDIASASTASSSTDLGVSKRADAPVEGAAPAAAGEGAQAAAPGSLAEGDIFRFYRETLENGNVVMRTIFKRPVAIGYQGIVIHCDLNGNVKSLETQGYKNY